MGLRFLYTSRGSRVTNMLQALVTGNNFSRGRFRGRALFFLGSGSILTKVQRVDQEHYSGVVGGVIQRSCGERHRQRGVFRIAENSPKRMSVTVVSLSSFHTLLRRLSCSVMSRYLASRVIEPTVRGGLGRL